MEDKEKEPGRRIMNCLRKIKWGKLLFPPKKTMMLCVPVSMLLLSAVFIFGWKELPVSYVAYLLSSYSLVTVCAALPEIIAHNRAIRSIQCFLSTNSFTKRYSLDVPFRVFVNLIRALGINLVFAAIKTFYAVKYSSMWFGALAVYYVVLCGIRLFLAGKVHRKIGGDEYGGEWRDYLVTGILLFVLNITVTGFVVQMVRNGEGYVYPGVLIYAVAAYTFYCVVMSVISAVRTGKHKSPLLAAVRIINLSTAGVTVFNLQTAMLAEFGTDSGFTGIMNTVVGAGVCIFIVGLALYMLFRAGRHIKSL